VKEEEENSAKCGVDISPRGIERILVAGANAEEETASFRLLAKVAPELRLLNAALRDGKAAKRKAEEQMELGK
jgi:hypothetical protein